MLRKTSLFLLSLILLFASCNKKDKIVAQVYYYKLYESEIANMMPSGLNPTDSLAIVQDYIDHWVKEKLILHEAEKRLNPREKNFDKRLQEYRNNLLINAYYEKLINENDTFNITEADLRDFTKTFDKRYTIDKEIIKVNYVKLAKGSALIEPVKAILFDANKRIDEKEQLIKLLGDSIEYLIDDEAWLYLDDIQNEVAFELPAEAVTNHENIEKEVGDYHYLLAILDYKSQRSVSETAEEKAAAEMMILNQRKQEYIKKQVDELYQKAMEKGVIMH